VVRVILLLFAGLAKLAVTPVDPETPLIAEASEVKSVAFVRVALIALPFNVMLTAPALTNEPKVAELDAVAVTPIPTPAEFMFAATSAAEFVAAKVNTGELETTPPKVVANLAVPAAAT